MDSAVDGSRPGNERRRERPKRKRRAGQSAGQGPSSSVSGSAGMETHGRQTPGGTDLTGDRSGQQDNEEHLIEEQTPTASAAAKQAGEVSQGESGDEHGSEELGITTSHTAAKRRRKDHRPRGHTPRATSIDGLKDEPPSSSSKISVLQNQDPPQLPSRPLMALRGARAAAMERDRQTIQSFVGSNAIDDPLATVQASTSASMLDLDPASSKSTTTELTAALQEAEAARAGLLAEIERLKKENTFKDELIDSQRSSLTYLHGQASCTICLELAWRPHVLSPCGHTFCARCLLDWFKRPVPGEMPIPGHLQGEARILAEENATLKRKKLCPHCRSAVESLPAEVWSLKGMVDRLHSSQMLGQVAPDANMGIIPQRTAEEEALLQGDGLPTGKDLWKSVFDPEGPAHRVWDEADGVYRCSRCYGEVAWGECSHCGFYYESASDLSGMDADSDMISEMEHLGELEAGTDEDESSSQDEDPGFTAQDDEEDSEMNGFIVEDGDSESEVQPSTSGGRRYGYSDDDDEDSNDDDEEDDDDDNEDRQHSSGQASDSNFSGFHCECESQCECEDDSDDDFTQGIRQYDALLHRNGEGVFEDESSSSSSDTSSSVRPGDSGTSRHVSRRRNDISSSSSEADSDDGSTEANQEEVVDSGSDEGNVNSLLPSSSSTRPRARQNRRRQAVLDEDSDSE